MKYFHFLSLLTFSLFNSQVSKETLKIIKPLENYSTFYALDRKPEAIKTKLKQSSSNDELFYLVNNGKNPYVKSIAVDLLVSRNDNRIADVFKNSISSKDEINYSTTCLSDNTLLSTYIFETAVNNPNISNENREKLKEDLIQFILNSKPINVKLLEQIKYNIPENSENYNILRNQVVESRSPDLLISLAKYKNPNDIELIQSFGEDSFLAIEEFPDDRFLPFLNDNIQHSTYFPFMFALSSYCNEEAKKIVDKVIEFKKIENKKNDCGNNCLNIIYNQIDKNKCSIFQPSLEQLWLTDKIISFDVLNNFEKNNSKEKTIEFLMKGFLQDGEPEIITSNVYDMENVMENLTDNMTYDGDLRLIKLLEKIKSLSIDSYYEAVGNSLKFIDDLSTESFILKLNDNATVLQHKDVLIEKLRTNESAYGLISIMDGIRRLNDKKLFEEGAKIVVQRKKEFSKYPVWEKAYKGFIKDNNIKE